GPVDRSSLAAYPPPASGKCPVFQPAVMKAGNTCAPDGAPEQIGFPTYGKDPVEGIASAQVVPPNVIISLFGKPEMVKPGKPRPSPRNSRATLRPALLTGVDDRRLGSAPARHLQHRFRQSALPATPRGSGRDAPCPVNRLTVISCERKRSGPLPHRWPDSIVVRLPGYIESLPVDP